LASLEKGAQPNAVVIYNSLPCVRGGGKILDFDGGVAILNNLVNYNPPTPVAFPLLHKGD